MHQSNIGLTNAFMDPSLPTMAQLIENISGDVNIPVIRRRNLTSSIRRFCEALGYEPSQVPANHSYFRQRLKLFHPLEAGLSKKRWQTIKSDVNAALALKGISKGQTRGLAQISPDWVALKRFMGNQRYDWGFSRLARFCSNKGLSPSMVNDEVLAAFAAAMRDETFKTKLTNLMRELCRKWNELSARAPTAGLSLVTVPSHRKNLTVPLDSLPEGFRADAERFLAEMSTNVHPLAETGPTKPLRQASIDAYRYLIRRCHAALVAIGYSTDGISNLTALVDNAKAILEHFYNLNGGKTSSTIHSIAHVLYLIAGPGGRASAAVAEQIKKFRARLAPPRDGMRNRPRSGLRPFADQNNIEKILLLPGAIYARLRRKSSLTKKDARLMQVAVALELLLMRPIRRKNLVELRLGENVIRSKSGTFIRLPADTVKNDTELDYKIPRESGELLDFYTKELLPLFGTNPTGWLFPGEKAGKPKSGAQFGRAFTKTIQELTGIYLYPHLTRHFAALVYLQENPGAFEIVRRLLAHKSLTTTTRSYAKFDDDAAVRLYDQLILRIRDSIGVEDQHERE